MRARNIKPSIFSNEILGIADPFLTLLFIGLWCIADKRGRLEDRPLRIKAEIFPYRNDLDINRYLTDLSRLGFVQRYVIERIAYIQVINFEKHQHPHHTEKESIIHPPPPLEVLGDNNNGYLTVKEPEINRHAPSDSLIPDSLIPDSKKTLLSKSKIPILDLPALWKRFCADLPQIRELTQKRKNKIRLRLNEHPEEEFWITVMKRISSSPFCLGNGSTGWKASFDWVIENPENCLKVLEGKYDNGGNNVGTDGQRRLTFAEIDEQNQSRAIRQFLSIGEDTTNQDAYNPSILDCGEEDAL